MRDERWADPAHQELTHYHKFRQLAEGVVPIGAVRPAPVNPVTSDFPAPIRPVSDLFNALYRYTYLTLHELFQPFEDKGPLVGRLYRLMSHGMRPLARYLMEQEIGEGLVAGPTFQRYEFEGEPLSQMKELARRVGDSHPELSGLVDLVDSLPA